MLLAFIHAWFSFVGIVKSVLKQTTIDPAHCQQFFSDLNTKDCSLLQNWFTDESTVCIPPATAASGRGRILALFRAIFRKYASLNWQITEIFQLEEKRFMIFSTSGGIFKNEQPYANLLATDIRFNNELKIVHLSDYFKNTAIFQQ